MPPRSRAARAERERRGHARRSWASATVAAFILADIWMVAAAHPHSGPANSAAASTHISTTAPDPTGIDSAETVPDTALWDLPPTAAAPEPTAAPAPAEAPPASGAQTARSRATSPTPAASPVPVPVVERGDGHFTVLPVPAIATTGSAKTGRIVRYTVEMEGGLGVDPVAYSNTVASILTDPRGWQAKDGVRFVNVTPAQAADGSVPTLRIRLTSPATTDRMCAPLLTRGKVSCHNGSNVVLNARRWLLGADAYGKDVASYRIYLVNHEVGHGIGHDHATCPGAGKVAPVMMQQTYGVGACSAWPWPKTK